MTGYPRHFEGGLWLVAAVIAASGILLVPAALELRWARVVTWRLPPGSGFTVATAHGVAASVFTALYGAIWIVHMRSGWRRGRHCRSGLTAALVLGGLVATGWGIYYAGEVIGAWTSAIHIAVGLVAAPLVWIHVRRGKRRQDRRTEPYRLRRRA